MSISGFFQFIIGFVIGVLLLAGSGAAAAYFFLSSLAENPPKPVFSEEQPEPEAVTTTTEETTETVAEEAQESEATESESATSEPDSPPTEKLEEGAYKARVTWSQGLSLRAEPTQSSQRIGGLDYNQEVVILGMSDDQEWENIRVPRNGKKGWIKSGNTQKVSD
jgi:hypothetical protein